MIPEPGGNKRKSAGRPIFQNTKLYLGGVKLHLGGGWPGLARWWPEAENFLLEFSVSFSLFDKFFQNRLFWGRSLCNFGGSNGRSWGGGTWSLEMATGD